MGLMEERGCSVPGCAREHDSRGYCKGHAAKARYAGLLEVVQVHHRDDSLVAKFRRIGWTVAESGCWEWNGARDQHCYGLVRAPHGVIKRAHRVAYESLVGSIPTGFFVCHHCDNPPCVNPAHLFAGTQAENVADMVRKGRANLSGLSLGRSDRRLTDDEVRDIRSRCSAGEPQISVARLYGVRGGYINNIIRGRRRTEVA